MLRVFPILAAIAIIVGSGVAQGLFSDRWALSPEPRASAQRLDLVARTVGDWESKDQQELTKQERAIGKIEGYLARVYVHRHSGMSVNVVLLCGRPGPISVHPPDVCLVGGGHKLLSKNRAELEFEPGAPPAQFLVGLFRQSDVEFPSYARVFWSWSASGTWAAPDSPRLKYVGKPALFKLYLAHDVVDENEPEDHDVALDFAKVFLPELQRALFSQPAPAAPGTVP